MMQQFLYQDEKLEATLNHQPQGMEVIVGGNRYIVSTISPGKYRVAANGQSRIICCVIKGDKSFLDIDGLLLELTIPSDDGPGASAAAHAVAKDKIFAPMPGKIVKLLVKEGDKVELKQPMVIVEAMKMENQVNSPSAGTVRKINFRDGDQVGTEIPIIELEI